MPAEKKVTYHLSSNGCHICDSHAVNTKGIIMKWYDGGMTSIQKWIYIQVNGRDSLNKGDLITMSCKDRKCINQEHFIVSTRSQINKDIGRARDIKYIVNEMGCHEVTSHYQGDNGYCYKKVEGKLVGIHRLVYEEHNGSIPDGMVVRHICDNPPCVNPAHLILGTHIDNVADRVARNRSAIGTRNGRSKLDPDKVRVIREDTVSSTADLARKYGVDQATLQRARDGRTWKKVE
jgi:hypothetical protein